MPLGEGRDPGDVAGNPAYGSPGVASVTATAPGTTPAAEAYTPSYKYFTPEELAASGVNMEDWFGQYANTFGPDANAQTYAGMPIAVGYIDESGKFVGNPFGATRWMNELRNLERPDLSANYNALNQANTGLQGIISQLQGFTPMTADQRRAYGEQMMGFQPGAVEGMNQRLGGGISGMTGLGENEKTLYNRQMMNQIETMRTDAREMLGAIGGSGRSIAAFDAMQAISSQIADFGIQSRLALIENDWAKKQLEYNALKEQRDQAVEMGLEGSQQYEAALLKGWEEMITGYATEITALSNMNEQYTNEFNSHADALYKSMMMEIGVTEAAMDLSYELFAQSNLPQTKEEWDALFKELLGD